MNRLLLLVLFLFVFNAKGTGAPPFIACTQNTAFVFFDPAVFADTIPPTIVCPKDITLTASGPQCTATFSYTILVEDDQPDPVLTQTEGLPSGSAFPVGVTGNGFSVTDGGGNLSACWFSVTVIATNFIPVCKDFVQISLGPDCYTQLLPAQLLDGMAGGCQDTAFIVEIDKIPPYGNGPWLPGFLNGSDLGKMYQFRLTDISNGNKCWGTVKTVDGLPPVIVCEDITVPCAVSNLAPAYLTDSLGIASAYPGVSDNCGIINPLALLEAALPEDCTSGFTQTIQRRWTATDNSGNSSSCVQQVHLLLLHLPDVHLPPDITIDCANPDISADKTGKPFYPFGGKKFYDLCTVGYAFTDTLLKICPGHDRVKRTWTLIDFCTADIIDTVQYIDIQSQTGLKVVCDSAIAVLSNPLNCKGTVELPAVGLIEDCSPAASVKAYWNTGGTPDSLSGLVAGGGTIGVFGTVDDFPAGAAVIHYVATDSCGNTGACDLNLQVWDGAPPTAGCVLFSAVNLSAAGTASISAASLNYGSADDCGTLTFKARRADAGPCQPNSQFYDAAAFCCADIGDTVAVILRVYDVPVPPGAVSPDLAATQSAECISYIKIEDNNGPVCAPPADITVTCDVFDPALATYGDLVSQSCAVDSVLKTADYSLFDTICSRGTINRVFRVFDTMGSSGACTQQITVDYDQDYYVRFPNDVIVTLCDGTGNFGTPAFSGNDCESLEATFADQIFYIVPDACYKIERTWTIINRCAYDSNAALIVVPNPNPSPVSNHALNLPGPVVSAPGTSGAWAPTQVKINPSDPQATNFSTFWSDTSNGYQYKQIIKILDSQKPLVQNCPGTTGSSDTTANDPLLWNETYWMAPGGGNDLPDAPAELTVTATDLCSGANLSIHCVLFLDLDGNGTKETAIDSYNPPAPGYVNFNNAANPNYSGGTSRRFDERFVTPDEQYRFAVHQSIDGQKLTATLQWKTLAQMPGGNGPLGLPGIAPQLPHGTHSIKWFVTDNCGNEAVCSHDFLIDNTAPFITCDSAISIEIPPNSFASLLVDDLLATFGDNTPGDQLAFSLRKAGAGSGFPLNNAGDPVSTLTYPCSETGAQTAELWVQDLAGNTAFCETLVTVTDADSSCFYSPLTVAGQFSPAVEGVGVTLAISPLQAPPVNLTDVVDGSFEFADAVPHGADYTLTPLKNSNPLNGVSTYDLVLITQHILNLQPLDSPQKLIAADVNKSNLVTTFDVVELRKLILGIYNVFPNNTSWRFIDKDFVFPDPNNPFLTPFPEFITRADVTMDQLEDDFTAVKVGDVNGTALVNDLVPVDDRSAGTLFFDLANRQVKTGEEFSARFKGSEPVLGYQFTLMYDGLEVLDILPATGVPNDRFAVFPGEPGTGAVTASVTEPVNEFAVRFRAVKNGRLSDLLRISSRITRAEAYGNCGNYGNCPLLVALRFGDAAPEDGSRQGLELDQNVPNPFDDATVIGFNLPADSDLTWTITDETGRLLRTESAHFKQGRHTIQITRRDLKGNSGVFFYRVSTEKESVVRKMVRQ